MHLLLHQKVVYCFRSRTIHSRSKFDSVHFILLQYSWNGILWNSNLKKRVSINYSFTSLGKKILQSYRNNSWKFWKLENFLGIFKVQFHGDAETFNARFVSNSLYIYTYKYVTELSEISVILRRHKVRLYLILQRSEQFKIYFVPFWSNLNFQHAVQENEVNYEHRMKILWWILYIIW